MLLRITIVFFLALGLSLSCSDDDPVEPEVPDTSGSAVDTCETPRQGCITEYTYRVINSYPHDTGAFTQGLQWVDSVLIEGTGYRGGSSTLRRVRLETGEIIQQRETPEPAFGEGVAQIGDRIVQLTWVSKIAWVYDAATFDSIGEYSYVTEGWGLTHDGSRFIMSDGTATLYFRDFDTFDVTGSVVVIDEDGAVDRLNELEYIDGSVYANVWQTDFIVIVDPETGYVTGRIDLSGIQINPPEVLNGIAYDEATNRLFVTGKLWPKLYEIELVEKP